MPNDNAPTIEAGHSHTPGPGSRGGRTRRSLVAALTALALATPPASARADDAAIATARATSFFSSRTLPGQLYARKSVSTSGETVRCLREAAVASAKK